MSRLGLLNFATKALNRKKYLTSSVCRTDIWDYSNVSDKGPQEHMF